MKVYGFSKGAKVKNILYGFNKWRRNLDVNKKHTTNILNGTFYLDVVNVYIKTSVWFVLPLPKLQDYTFSTFGLLKNYKKQQLGPSVKLTAVCQQYLLSGDMLVVT